MMRKWCKNMTIWIIKICNHKIDAIIDGDSVESMYAVPLIFREKVKGEDGKKTRFSEKE